MKHQRAHNVTAPRLLAVALLVAVATTAPSWAAPQLSFAADRVIAEGLNPGGEACLFAVVHRQRGWDQVIKRVDRIIADEDSDGIVELVWEEDAALPQRSLWVVIDLSTGETDVAAPHGAGVPALALDSDDLVLAGDEITGIRQQHGRYLEVLLVSPGLGAWRLTTGDGAPSDADGVSNGEVEIAFAGMEPLSEDDPPPPRAMPGGTTIAIIQALDLEAGILQVGAGTGGEEAAR